MIFNILQRIFFFAGDERKIKSLRGTGQYTFVAFERPSPRPFRMDDYHTYYGGGRF